MTLLLELAIKTSVPLAAGLLAALALRKRSAAVRHWVLAAALVCGAGAPVLARLAPSWTLPGLAATAAERRASVDVSFGRLQHSGADAAPSPTMPAVQSPLPARVAMAVVPLWLGGAALNLLVLLVGMSRLSRLRWSPAPLAGSRVAEALQHLAAAFQLRRPIALIRGARPAVIVTWGFLRPKVLLPADADAWPRQRLEVVLAHECAHIARSDWLVQTVAELCKAVYWFNPLFWIACARLRYESERACDDAVMHTGVSSDAYATELLGLARRFARHPRVWAPAPAMAVSRSNLERRVRAMLNNRLDRRPISRGGRWTSALVLFVVTLAVATFAQGGFATFSGTVVDSQDRVLPGATVTVSDARRDVKHETKTDRNGRFELVGLPAGDYTVEMKLPGFRTLHDIGTINGESLDRTWKMQVGELQETITVTSDDGAVTSSRQSGNAYAKPPNPVCAPGAANGLGGNIRPPRKVKDVRPGYPGAAGNVELAATIGTDGSVTDVQVVKSDHPELAPAAIDAVRQWEFTSTLLNCVPIEVQMNVSVTFRRNQ